MQDKKSPVQIAFAIRGITTEQFAILQETLAPDTELQMLSQIRFAKDVAEQMIGVFAQFTFEQEGKTLITVEAGCHFALASEGWAHFCPAEENSERITVPKDFAIHLALITVGTVRGILHARTANTAYNQIVLPTVNLVEMFPEDIVID